MDVLQFNSNSRSPSSLAGMRLAGFVPGRIVRQVGPSFGDGNEDALDALAEGFSPRLGWLAISVVWDPEVADEVECFRGAPVEGVERYDEKEHWVAFFQVDGLNHVRIHGLRALHRNRLDGYQMAAQTATAFAMHAMAEVVSDWEGWNARVVLDGKEVELSGLSYKDLLQEAVSKKPKPSLVDLRTQQAEEVFLGTELPGVVIERSSWRHSGRTYFCSVSVTSSTGPDPIKGRFIVKFNGRGTEVIDARFGARLF